MFKPIGEGWPVEVGLQLTVLCTVAPMLCQIWIDFQMCDNWSVSGIACGHGLAPGRLAPGR